MRRTLLLVLVMAACGRPAAPAEPLPAQAAPASPHAIGQRPGDPARGYRALVGDNYVGCGVPRALVERFFGRTPPSFRLLGREGASADLPYFLTASIAPSGVEIVSPNCLTCHAAMLDGRLVMGLGEILLDFTSDPAPLLASASAAAFFLPGPERAELERFLGRARAIAPFLRTETIGANPADHLAAALFAHRDRRTLAWSDAPILAPPPAVVPPVDVPAWWNVKKKSALFYTGAGRGDHARLMMTASVLCVDSLERARAIDAYFPDIRAYLASLEPPPWPRDIDDPLAASGRRVFDAQCAECHGTYGPGGHYPNRVVDLDEIGTDATLAAGVGMFAGRFVAWFNGSFYGELAHLEPRRGYVAPPLDGIWATAPYFHNGSVPTLAGVLDAARRPRVWKRSRGRDWVDVGLAIEALASGRDAALPEERPSIYDTTRLGHGNGGHTYGDALTPADRRDLLEYLKTL